MPLSLFIDIQYEQPPGVAARKWSDFAKAGNEAVAETWHEKYLPSHFRENAQTRYNLQARRESTKIRKARLAKRGQAKHGGRRPLVETGLLQEQATRRPIVRAYPKRLTVTMPTHVPRRPRNSSIDLHEEVVRTIPTEQAALAKIWRRVVTEKLESYRPRRRVRL